MLLLGQMCRFAVPSHPSHRRKANTNSWKSPFPSSHVQTMDPFSSFPAPTSNLPFFANTFPLKLGLVLEKQLSRPRVQKITMSHRLKFTWTVKAASSGWHQARGTLLPRRNSNLQHPCSPAATTWPGHVCLQLLETPQTAQHPLPVQTGKRISIPSLVQP